MHYSVHVLVTNLLLSHRQKTNNAHAHYWYMHVQNNLRQEGILIHICFIVISHHTIL